MVSFVAQEPDVNPANTAFWARPIREPKVDVSGETLGRTVGSALKEGLSFADDYMREGVVKPNVNLQVNQLRDQFVDALNTAREQVEPQPLGAPKSLSEESREALPSRVAAAGDKVDMLQKAMESGKLSETDYYGRLDAMAKQLRAQYPGYKDEVDREISRVTGVHPANQYIRGMLSDLNRLVAQHGETKDRFTSQVEWATHNGLATGEEVKMWMNQHQQGKMDEADILSLLAGRQSKKAQHDDARFDWAKTDYDAKQASTKAIGDLTKIVTDTAQNNLDNIKIAQGTFKGQSAHDVLAAYGRGDIQIPDEDWQYLAAQLETQKNLMRQEFTKAANASIKMKDGTTSTLAASIRGTGEKTADEVIDAALSDWQKLIDQAGGKNFSMHHFSGELITAKSNDVQLLGSKDQELMDTLGMADLARKHLGDQGFASFLQQHQDISDRLDKGLRNLFNQDRLSSMTQPRQEKGGQPYQFTDQLKDAQNKGVEEKDFYQHLLHGADMITDKSTDQKTRTNLINYYFGSHAGELATVVTKGQINAFQTLYSPIMSRTIAKTNPELYEQYKQGAEMNARALFTNDINNLKTLTQHEGAGAMQIDWVHDHFEVKGARPSQSGVQDVNRINIMLQNLKGVYDNDHSGSPADVETFMFARLVEMGFDPRKNIGGVPEQIMTALMSARGASGATEKPAGESKQREGRETPE